MGNGTSVECPAIRLTLRGLDSSTNDSLVPLTRQFVVSRCVKVPGFLDPRLLAWVQAQVDRATFHERTHGLIASELCMERNVCLGLLHFLVNDPAVFRFIESISGVQPITSFNGRVYRRVPGGQHHDSWHSDVHPDRGVGMSVNLGPTPYAGGMFEIREEDTDPPLGAILNTGPGDAILFAIAEGLEHRVAPLDGIVPKTAFAGWFGSTRDYVSALRRDPFMTEDV